MHFFQWIRWGSLFQQSGQPQSSESGRRARASTVRTTPKHDGKIEPVLTVLETRELIGSFVADVALAAGGVAAAERASDPFADPSLVDLSVSGGSGSGTSPTAIERGGWQGAVPPRAEGSGVRGQESGFGGQGSGSFEDGADLRYALDNSPAVNSQALRLDETTAQLSALNHSTLNDTVPDVMPRPHGVIRKLQLAPPASAVGASTTFVANTSGPSSQAASDMEMPSLDASPSFAVPTRTGLVPPVPIVPNGDTSTSSEPASSTSPEGTAADTRATDTAHDSETDASGSGAVGTWAAGADSGSTELGSFSATTSPTGDASMTPPRPGCSGGGGPFNSGGGPPTSQPDQCSSSSVADPLFVINWNDGLVMAPDVVEFDVPGETVELRGQVYGATVQSWSWDLSQAGTAACVTGTDTYKLRFVWNTASPPIGETYVTNTITVTATMTDQTTQTMTLKFKVSAGNHTCMSAGASATWPAVLTPDKVLQGSGNGSQGSDQIVSDSATRPYAISQESGVLYVGHGLPEYNPGVPALGLTYSSIAADRQPIFVGRYELDPSAAVPNTVSARLQFNGSWGSSKYYDTSPSTTKHNPGNVLQISLQADGGSLATGRYDYTFETTANYSGSSTTTSSSGTVTIINEETSPFGEGWTLALPQFNGSTVQLFNRIHVVTGGVILNQGAGNSLWFAESGGSYTTPAGDFSTLVKNQDNSYTRTLKSGTQQNFNSSGYQTSIVDLNSNRLTFTYDGNNLWTITDPNNLVTTFSYSGDCGAGVPSAKACTITDPAGRVTTFSYSSGRLDSLKDPDGAITTFTYDSTSGRMTAYKDPLGNVSTFTYNFAGRVTTVTRPDSTTETFKALQLQSLCGSGECTSGQPGTPLLSAEAVADYTDPRSNAWDTRLDWFGLGTTTQLTDPLGQTTPAGHMIVLHRNANACATQVTDRVNRDTRITLDSKCNPTKITHPDGTNIQFEFNSNSQPTKRIDEMNNVTTFTYDSEGNLTQITEADPDGGGSLTAPVTTFTYTADGFVETVVDARSKTTTLSYDSRDRVTQITYPDDDGVSTNNPKVTFTYDSASNVKTRVDERGYTTSMSYDGLGRVRTVTTPDRDGAGGLPAPVTTFTYDSGGNLTQTTRPDPDGTGSLTAPVTTLTYDSMNRLRTSVDALSNTTTFSYDNAGNLTVVTDPLARVTTFTYNELGQRTVITQPDPDGGGPLTSPVTTFTYDAEAQLLTVKDPLNRVTTNTWNSRGWCATVTDPLGNTASFTYNAVGNPSTTTYPGQTASVTYTYDNLHRLTGVTDQLSQTTSYGYDAVGNRTTMTDPLSHTTTFAYDARNRLTVVTRPDPDGGGSLTSPVTTFTYDLAGNRTGVTDPLSRTTTYAFDAGNRLSSITQPDPDGGGSLTSPITTFVYDNLDRLTSLTDPVNNVTSWTYDAVDQVLTELDPLSKTTTYTYDAAGQLTRIVDRKSQRRDFAYDNDGRRTQEYWCPAGSGSATGCGTSTPTRIFTHTYDSANQLTEVNETDSRYTFTYDNAGRVTGISSLGSNMPQVQLTNTWNAVGSRTAVSDNLSTSGTLSFTYDDAQRTTNAKMTVGGTVGPNVTLSYDAANRLTSMSRQDGTNPMSNRTLTTLTYDNADRNTAITHTYQPSMGSPTTLATYTYAYNAASELTVETNKDGTLTYTYDNTSQLTGVDGSGGTCGATGCDETFSYDTNGNRTMTGYTTGSGNRLTSDGTYNYTFDDNGNTLTKTRISDSQKTEFSWDYRNRLTQVVVKDSSNNILQQSDYTYDAFDRRIIKSFDDDGPGPHTATVTKTLYDGASFAANPYADFNGSNTLTMRYLYGPAVDFILARRDASGTVAWYLADHLGTVRDLVNTSGTVLDHMSYSAYGKVTAETNPSNGDRFKFTGREYDSETGLDYYRGRYFDPADGRFVSLDPIGFRAGDTDLYRYVLNSPTNAIDPTGLIDWGCILHPIDCLYFGTSHPTPDQISEAGDALLEGLPAELAKAEDRLIELGAVPGIGKLGPILAGVLAAVAGPELQDQAQPLMQNMPLTLVEIAIATGVLVAAADDWDWGGGEDEDPGDLPNGPLQPGDLGNANPAEFGLDEDGVGDWPLDGKPPFPLPDPGQN